MIVTTCGAAGVLGAFGGAAGFGDGAGVCAVTQAKSAKTNNVTRCIDLKFIPATTKFTKSLLQDFQDYQTRFGAN
jgi:hypothetical protein